MVIFLVGKFIGGLNPLKSVNHIPAAGADQDKRFVHKWPGFLHRIGPPQVILAMAITDAGVAWLAALSKLQQIEICNSPQVSRNSTKLFREGVRVHYSG